tara:strand:- start:154 stop:492 length:339 start_codon:yes stop_codon:yes gene_type:complete
VVEVEVVGHIMVIPQILSWGTVELLVRVMMEEMLMALHMEQVVVVLVPQDQMQAALREEMEELVYNQVSVVQIHTTQVAVVGGQVQPLEMVVRVVVEMVDWVSITESTEQTA